MTFPGAHGHELAARYHEPAGPLRGAALFAHCFTCSKDVRAARNMAGALAAHGIATLRFDFTGLGESDGDFADTTFSSNTGDLLAAAAFMREELGAPPTLLIGHSLGGAAVLAAADRVPEAKVVVTIGAPADPAHVTHTFAESTDEIAARGEAVVQLAGRPFRIKRDFLEDLAQHGNADKIGSLGRALLIFHSPTDDVVGIDNARQIYEAARHPKSFVSLDGADHLLSRESDADYVAAVIAAWGTRYLPAKGAPEVPRGTVVANGSRGFQTHLSTGPHELVADEPRSYGGGDTGMTPYDLLSASLGACTAMTLRMYADRKQWQLENVKVSLQHSRVHATDCDDCVRTEGRVDQFTLELELEGDLDDEQRARLLEISHRCPVHRTLTNEIKVRTELVR
ncbi:MAG: bifunctional alpha/beta hydrolase/OsmC family protein [Myxococcota bacterium]